MLKYKLMSYICRYCLKSISYENLFPSRCNKTFLRSNFGKFIYFESIFELYIAVLMIPHYCIINRWCILQADFTQKYSILEKME